MPPTSTARAWLRQREAGAAAVAAIEERELAELTATEALAQSEALLAAAPIEVMLQGRRQCSGLVEQQRLFMRARR
jgi:hypothetical protein